MLEKNLNPQNKFIPGVALLISLFFLINGLYLLLYQAELKTTKQLQTELNQERLTISKLEETLTHQSVELDQLHVKHDQLLAEKEEWGQQRSYGGSGPTAYLTIDDGPSENTIKMLEILAEYKVPATFFVIGHNLSGDENIYQRIVDEGHALGNHTYTHNLSNIYRSIDTFMNDLLRLEEHLYEKTGIRPDIVRFPGGTSNTVGSTSVIQGIIRTLQERGYDYFDWNVSSGDANASLSSSKIVENVVTQVDQQVGRDVVVLLHDTYLNYNTVEALPQIIESLKARGYQFAPLQKGAINTKHR